MRFIELGEAPVGKDPLVLPRLAAVLALTAMDPDGIADPEPLRADVRERERLPPKDERANVVPAREVLGRRDRVTTHRQQSPSLGDELVGVAHMLDHLV